MPLIYKDVIVTKKEVNGFECNKCKEKYDSSDFVEIQEMMYWKTTGGYGSVWGDGNTIEITLCQSCAFEIFNDIVTDTGGGSI